MKRSSRNRKRDRRTNRRARELRKRGRPLCFESLEDRRVLATVSLDSGILSFSAPDTKANHVVFEIESFQGVDHIRITDHQSPLSAGAGVSEVNSTSARVPLANVDSISIDTGANADTIIVHANINRAIDVLAGADNDSLEIIGAAASDQWTLGGQFSGGATIDFDQLEAIKLSPQTGDDSILVQEDFAALGVELSVVGDANDDDHLTVSLTSANASLVSASETQLSIDNSPGSVNGFSLSHSNFSKVEITTGSAADDISIAPSTTTAFHVDGGAPGGALGDVVRVMGPASVQWTGTGEGVLQAPGKAQVTFSGVETALSNRLEVSLNATTVSEQFTGLEATVTRLDSDQDYSGELTISIAYLDPSELQGPTELTLQAGFQSAVFLINALDDHLLDGDQQTSIEVSANGLATAAADVMVEDHEQVTLSFDKPNISEHSGTGAAIGTLVRSDVNDLSDAVVVMLTNHDPSEIQLPASVTIPSGASSATFDVNAIDDATLDGAQLASITVKANGFEDTSANLLVDDYESLHIVLDAQQVREDANQLGGTVTRSNVDDLGPLTVSLSSDNDVATPPATVSFAAGETSASFTLDIGDNDLLDGIRTATITAAASGFVAAQEELEVLDFETLSVSLETSSMSENGGSIIATVTRNVVVVDTGLVVEVSVSDDSEASTPVSVVIPVGQSSASFTIDSVDDALLDGVQSVAVIVEANGYEGSHADFSVEDSEPLSLTLSTETISEMDSSTAALATVSRPPGQNGNSLVVTLISSNANIVQVPNSVSIPAGMDSAQFFISAVDDALLTGARQVGIAAYASSYENDTATLTVEDHEEIFVSIDREFIIDEQSATPAQVTVSRSNTNNSDPLLVNLTASPSGEVVLPDQVTIPAGASSVVVEMAAVTDNVVDPPVIVTVTGQAESYHSNSDTIEVLDVGRLRVTASRNVVREDAGNGAIQLTITRLNEDISSALTVELLSADTSELQAPATVEIPAGQDSVTVALDVIDDSSLDGVQNAPLTISAPGYVDSTINFLVEDHETLNLQIASEAINEGDGVGATTATVFRSNSNVAGALRVSIFNSDASELVAPAIVEIPAGAQSVTFSIDAVNDSTVDGNQEVTLTATAEAYQQSDDTVTVVDFGTFLNWTNPEHPYDIDANQYINVRDALLLVYELRTRGPIALPAPTPAFGPAPFLDANADGQFNAIDPFLVIDFLNKNGPMPIGNAPDAEGEGGPAKNVDGQANVPAKFFPPGNLTGGNLANNNLTGGDSNSLAGPQFSAASPSTVAYAYAATPNSPPFQSLAQGAQTRQAALADRGDRFVAYGAARYAAQFASPLTSGVVPGDDHEQSFADADDLTGDLESQELDDILEVVAEDVDQAITSGREKRET